MTVKHILFPVDFSSQVTLVAPYVRALAGNFGAKVTLLSVAPPVWMEPQGAVPAGTTNAAALELKFREHLEKAFATELDGILTERAVRSGDPAAEIVHFAQTHGVDFIMMPTHGYGGFRARLMGSVALKVLHDAPCPVWTAAHASEQRASAVPRTILCAVDQSTANADLMRWAAAFSQSCGAELKLLHVVPGSGDWMAFSSEVAMQDALRREARAKLDAVRQSLSIKAPLRIAAGEVTRTVSGEARIEDADLVVIGRGKASRLRRGAHAYGIVHQSPCPVITVPL